MPFVTTVLVALAVILMSIPAVIYADTLEQQLGMEMIGLEK